MDDAAVCRVGNFGHGELFITGQNDSPVVYLAAAGGIERGAVQHDPRPWAFHDLPHFGIEIVEERVVVIEALCHAQNHISPQGIPMRQAQSTQEPQRKLDLPRSRTTGVGRRSASTAR